MANAILKRHSSLNNQIVERCKWGVHFFCIANMSEEGRRVLLTERACLGTIETS